ncbi:PucR family transcriptional regulator [Allosaccharopolyspora coralli]|uniref:PucR family transcriptional regulator n=1 Tax=Allosaccharopolyspora coralli TaxID=2665642 RepID=A0A5Q3QLK2_9PSEU|nr:helix-turn-helix domain-containing protein [Allosaccharopolyspora coralli]QGK72299.1 PucR family transcriptional regulator [Allosaccharopolyspora coralli]
MVTLDRLINVLGGYGARLVCAPHGRAVRLLGVAVHDAGEFGGADEVVLGVGVDSAEHVVSLVDRTQASVAVCRAEALGEDAVATANERGVALVLVDPAVSWGQVTGVVYGLVLDGRETEVGRGPTDLFALADSVAEAVAAPVTIEDQRSRVLAYSARQERADQARWQTILGRRVPEPVRRHLSERGVFTHLTQSDEPLFVPAEQDALLDGRMVAAVRAGHELLGSIWVETARPLGDAARAALTAAARTASLHMLRARASADLERQVESDLVIGLLEGVGDAPAAASQLGLSAEQFRVLAMRARSEPSSAAPLLLFERVTTGFGWSRPGRSALFADTVYTILPGGPDVSKVLSWVRSLDRELPDDVSLFVGVGGNAGLREVVASRREADESVAVHTDRGGPAVVYDDAWHEVLLRRLRHVAQVGRAPTRGPVVELRRHDAQRGTRYVETLRAWLECQGDLAAAAARLEVHPNTVRYRMRKLAEVTEVDLEDPNSRLAMIIELAVGEPSLD